MKKLLILSIFLTAYLSLKPMEMEEPNQTNRIVLQTQRDACFSIFSPTRDPLFNPNELADRDEVFNGLPIVSDKSVRVIKLTSMNDDALLNGDNGLYYTEYHFLKKFKYLKEQYENIFNKQDVDLKASTRIAQVTFGEKFDQGVDYKKWLGLKKRVKQNCTIAVLFDQKMIIKASNEMLDECVFDSQSVGIPLSAQSSQDYDLEEWNPAGIMVWSTIIAGVLGSLAYKYNLLSFDFFKEQ